MVIRHHACVANSYTEVTTVLPVSRYSPPPRSNFPRTRLFANGPSVETSRRSRARAIAVVLVAAAVCLVVSGCGARASKRTMEVTAYCSCSSCTDWERGRWRYLKLDFWNRYVSKGPDKGRRYSGRTASGSKPREPHPGLFSRNTLTHPWKLPGRLLLPWLWLARDGTIAADTRYYPFGTRIYVPGYGHGVVADRGGAIKGPKRLDLYFHSHHDARKWGRRNVEVDILE